MVGPISVFVFFLIVTAPPRISTLSLHDALPISLRSPARAAYADQAAPAFPLVGMATPRTPRSEEHTSELQSHSDLVCRLLLEKKKKDKKQESPAWQKEYHHLARIKQSQRHHTTP